MGIHQLNRFIRERCPGALRQLNLKELSGKTIVIDTSIYMYKFAKDESLIEGMFKMISTLLHYTITPIFIFDGKPPAEKNALLQMRREKKREAKSKYKTLRDELLCNGETEKDLRNNARLNTYKKLSVRIYRDEIEAVQKMLDLFGVSWSIADGEADRLCAEFVITNKAWGCLSDDMDMFVYGCPNILRYVSFMKESAILYNYEQILSCLNISDKHFKEMCVLAGTDYNDSWGNINSIYSLFNKYKVDKKTGKPEFYEWVADAKDSMKDIKELYVVGKMFEIDKTQLTPTTLTSPANINHNCLKDFLKKYNFIFVK